MMEQTNFDMQAANLVLTSALKAIVGRERPYVRECATNPDYASGCGHSNSENSSFFSGHTSNAFTSAGLVCARHARFEYGAAIDAEPHWGWDDTLACGTSLAAATATGLLRIAADEHYGTDVISGTVSGLTLGFLVPFLWEREACGQHTRRDTSWLVLPAVGRDAVGFVAVVRF
jgi:membrane-associated phospholipid phosphatase